MVCTNTSNQIRRRMLASVSSSDSTSCLCVRQGIRSSPHRSSMQPSLLTPALRRAPSSSAASASLAPTIALTTLYLQGDMNSIQPEIKAKRRPKRPADYDSNRARAMKYQEVAALRQTVQELESEIARLKTRRTVCGKSESLGVWERLALRQRRERRKAEEENRMLKHELDAQREIVRLFQGVIGITDPSAFTVKSIL